MWDRSNPLQIRLQGSDGEWLGGGQTAGMVGILRDEGRGERAVARWEQGGTRSSMAKRSVFRKGYDGLGT